MLSWSSDMKKFNFFDEKKYKDLANIQNIYDEEEDDDEAKKKNEKEVKPKHEIDTININNISISGPREIHAINGLLFINGKLIHDKDGKMIRENLIMKILDNRIIDLYRIFNGVYYRFEIKIFRQKPYFIVVGGNFNEFMINNSLELFMITSIKFYDATNFILKREEKYLPENLENSKEEPYPKLLLKNIKLIKRLSDEKIMCEVDELSMEGYESFQNINSFSINSEFTHAALSLDKGDIILIYAYPNLLECNNNDIKMIFLPKINLRDKGHVTNLFFTEINLLNNNKRILYASTSKIIYYYEWNSKSKLFSNEENNIKLKILNPGGPGGYNGCIDIKQKYLLMGSANNDFICEFENLEISKTWFFEGKKTNIYYFKDYILFAVSGESFSSLQVYDKLNSIFIYYKNIRKKIIGLCCDKNDIYVFFEKTQNYKYYMKLSEKTLKERIQILLNRKFYDIEVSYAENYILDQSTISYLSKIYAEKEYDKGNFKISVQQYIKTIGFYAPNYVIQKFNSDTKIKYLIIYLEKLLDKFENKKKINEEYENFSILLLSCYIMDKNIPIFKQYIQKKLIYFSKNICKKIIDICLDINEIEFALKFSKTKKLYIFYIDILFKQDKKADALNFIKNLSKGKKPEIPQNNLNETKTMINHYEIGQINKTTRNYSMREANIIPCKEIQNVFNEFAIYFLGEDDNTNIIDNNSLAYQFFETFMLFIYKNFQIIEDKDINILIHNFLYFNKYFLMLFDKLYTYPTITFDNKIINRRIELYLNDIKNSKDEKEKNIIIEKIFNLLTNIKYKDKYDYEFLFMLFRNNNFKKGMEFISEQKKSISDLLYIFFENKEYDKILNLFKKNLPKEKQIWEKTLQLFLQDLKENIDNDKDKDNSLKNIFLEYLSLILDNDIIPSIEILDIINGTNDEIPMVLIKNFFLKIIEKENNNLVSNLVKSKEYEANIQEVHENIKNLKEKPMNVRLTKCDECDMGIDFPIILFRCGHYYHSLCLYYYEKDLRAAFCPKCFSYRKKINAFNVECEKLYNALNSEEGMEKELSKQSNHIEFVNKLYSRGLFKLNVTNKEKNINK